jgi:transcriptional regulator with XRE-family HTH domain
MGERREVAERIGARARQLRIRAGLTQSEWAARAGVARQHVHRLERGAHVPSLLVLGRLASALGVPVVELVKPPERLRLIDRVRASRQACERLLKVKERAVLATAHEEN